MKDRYIVFRLEETLFDFSMPQIAVPNMTREIEWIKQLAHDLYVMGGYEIIIVSELPSVLRIEIELWLRSHQIQYRFLILPNVTPGSPLPILEFIKAIEPFREKVLFVIDGVRNATKDAEAWTDAGYNLLVPFDRE